MSEKSDDEKLVHAICHEVYLLTIAYKGFLKAILLNKKFDEPDIKLMLYNSYAQSILHLYEYMKACVVREKSKSQAEKENVVEAFIKRHAIRVTKEIEGGPSESLCEEFSQTLRKSRNKILGHVDKGRFELYPLVEFYRKYHVIFQSLILDAEAWWHVDSTDIASHNSVKEFSNMLTFGQSSWQS